MIEINNTVRYQGRKVPHAVSVPFHGDVTFRAVSHWIGKSLAKNTTWCWSARNGKFDSNGQEYVYFYFHKMEDAMGCALRWRNTPARDHEDYVATFLASL